jgi:hypothetical protein
MADFRKKHLCDAFATVFSSNPSKSSQARQKRSLQSAFSQGFFAECGCA